MPIDPGYFAAATFLIFTGTGYCAQALKLRQRDTAHQLGQLHREAVCDGLHPVRELWSFSAFMLFALSGLSRSYFDWVLVGSRFPVIMLATGVLYFLAKYGIGQARRFFRFALGADAVFIVLAVLMYSGLSVHGTFIPKIIDYSLAAVSMLLFYGKSLQAYTMLRQRRSAAVSWWRELGLICKDMAGLWYALSVGSELFWIALTHALSTVSSSLICFAKFWLEVKGSRKATIAQL